MNFSLYALIALTQTVNVVFSAAADGFTSIAGDYGSVESVDINLSCPTNQNIELPNLMFTITPGDAASVSSSPPNVVHTKVKDGVLSFTGYNLEAAGKSGGGVQITLPADSLKKVTIDGSNTAQVRKGFTSLEHIQANGPSTLTVTADISGTVSAGGASTISAGDISGTVSAEGASTISAGDISGTVRAGGASTINTSTCVNVLTTGAASCDDEGDAPSVFSDDSDEARMANGYMSCGDDGGSSDTYETYSDSSGSSPTVAIVTASLVAAAVVAQAM